MNIKENKLQIKLKAIQTLIDNKTYTKEEMLEIVDYNIETGKVTKEDVKEILEQLL